MDDFIIGRFFGSASTTQLAVGWGGRLVFFDGAVAGVDDFAHALPVGDEGGDGFGRTSRNARGVWGGGLQLGD